ncbi:MAG: S8 family peptidase, partial [Micropepsaceae bacterium]
MARKSFTFKYGGKPLTLEQSDKFIGVRGRRGRKESTAAAVRSAFGTRAWSRAGTLGGFEIVSVDDHSVDADRTLDVIRADKEVSVGTHVFHRGKGEAMYVPTGEVYIKFKKGTKPAVKQKLMEKHGLMLREARGEDALIVSVTTESSNPVKVAAALQQESCVDIAEPDLATKAAVKARRLDVEDTLMADQWHLRNTGFHLGTSSMLLKGADARVIDAWGSGGTTGLDRVVIAVIDDGFDLDHPDFKRQGKTVHPWDFKRASTDPRPDDGDWHGTACAGVATASLGGGRVVGAAPGCTLMPVRWGFNLADREIENWFEYVTAKGAWVVSCSWGALDPNFPLSTRAQDAVAKCAREGRGGLGCVVVFAAGNEKSDINDPNNGTVSGFAIHPDVVAVAASNSVDKRSHYSNFGTEISVCAPSNGAGGVGIITSDVTDPTGSMRGYATGDYTDDFGGTSSACPLVAGVAALVLSVAPGLSAREVKSILQRSARKIGKKTDYDANGHSRYFGFGCVNADAAVKLARPHGQPALANAAARSGSQRRNTKGSPKVAGSKPARAMRKPRAMHS